MWNPTVQRVLARKSDYLSFASKEEVFQALSQRLAQRMLAGAEAASPERQPAGCSPVRRHALPTGATSPRSSGS